MMSEIQGLVRLRALADRFPQDPGVYIMKDASGAPIYIGKAVDLRGRVRSYFADDHDDRPQIPFMLKRLHDMEWIVTTSETEALILESNLIRRHQPRFNIDLKDDKHFPYIKITLDEPFPRMIVTRRVANDGARYFGPFTDVGAMRRTMHFARKIFRIRDCAQRLPLARPARPCINFSMGRCSGACAGKISREDYRRNVEMLVRFLSGKRTDLLAELKAGMRDASARMEYERAAQYRDQVRLIEEASRMQRVDLLLPHADCDVFGFFDGDRHICMSVLAFREGLLLGARTFVFARESWEMEQAEHDHLVLQYYETARHDPPAEIVIPAERGFNADSLRQWFAGRFQQNVHIAESHKGTKHQLIEIAEKNARHHLAQKVPADPRQDIADLQEALSLPVLPLVIEAFDISNMGPAFAVAGMVRWVDGAPDKSGYRRFKIKTVQGQDDFAMMMEVVRRRLRRLSEEKGRLPDLLLIDGGKGQLSAAQKALSDLEHAPHVVSLAKREEEIFSPSLSGPVRLPPAHPARRLVQRIRDEAHRYAVTFHRTVRDRQFKRSALEQITGIGPKKATLLIRTFGSFKRVREAAPEEIAKVNGFTIAKARALLERLENAGSQKTEVGGR
jgi:excinuclease ABC subunit C